MNFLLLNILLAILPALALILYFYRRDSQKKEPVVLIWKIFVIGFFSVFPAVLIELVLDEFAGSSNSLQNIFVRAFVVAALVEEGIKLAVVRFFVFNRNDFDEITDGIIYTITASMGFACFENILYSTGGLSTVLLRAFTAVPLHAIASGIMGYYIGYSKFSDTNAIAKGLLIAVVIHGLYDFVLFTGTALGFLVIPLLIICWFILRKLMKKALLLDRMTGRS
ncbi:MAG: PrsW family glutamic-type intramembrane protease [Spirochaetales bacterium]|uniref:Protease PrsW n=1 Tax=Candidatus Thalassospirochaeta sargassi TaxID=3119039 RepID=A0AAJ1ILF3_9SPIO|nr:PrsW family glutamic-type intramembrane protease [Spirochaetales bacterium]